MARSQITGRRKLRGNSVSHSNVKTGRWQNVNVQRRRLWVHELGRFVSLRLTTRDLRSIDKMGLLAFARKHGASVEG
jgi:large subunit ribosomal protein L28